MIGKGASASKDTWRTSLCVRATADEPKALLVQALSLAKGIGFKWNMTFCLTVASRLAAMVGRREQAARLSGAAESLGTAVGGTFLTPIMRTDYERHLSALRETLGDAAFRASSAEGRAMNLDQAIEDAMLVASRPAADHSAVRRDAGGRHSGPLTPREREVAILVAQGFSNRAIAARLVISERTAETHIQHIFTKLGLEARTQVAAWVVQHGLMPPSAGAGPTA